MPLKRSTSSFSDSIHCTKRSVKQIDRREKCHLFFFIQEKNKATLYFRYSTNHSSRQILGNILRSFARGHELSVCLKRASVSVFIPKSVGFFFKILCRTRPRLSGMSL